MSAPSNFLKKGSGAKYTLHRRPHTANCSKRVKIEVVPPFSIQSLQKNTVVLEPKFGKKFIIDRHNFPKPATSFRMYYDRGDLPIKMEYLIGGEKISWTVDIDKLDYTLYLPLFFDGLSETQHPYKTFARQGVQDLLSNGGDKIFPIIPQLIIPIKNALNTKNIEVMCTIMKVIQQLVTSSDLVGPAMVPFYRQLLPVFNAYKTRNINLGDCIDYAQKNNLNLGDLIDETLQVLEKYGGEDAFINIKYLVPTYESTFIN